MEFCQKQRVMIFTCQISYVITGTVIRKRRSLEDDPIYLEIDHPFVVAIVHKAQSATNVQESVFTLLFEAVMTRPVLKALRRDEL